jgi:hypothetical protein
VRRDGARGGKLRCGFAQAANVISALLTLEHVLFEFNALLAGHGV